VAALAIRLLGSSPSPVFAPTPPEVYKLKLKLLSPHVIILRLKCTKIDFFWGFALDPAEGAYSAPRTS